jgi:hypothetical protein
MKSKLGESDHRAQDARGGCQPRATCDIPADFVTMKNSDLISSLPVLAVDCR